MELFQMRYTIKLVIIFMFFVNIIGCTLNIKPKDSTLKSELNYALEKNVEIPESLPEDIPFPKDMQAKKIIDNETVSQIIIETSFSMNDLEVMYESYLNSDTFSSKPEKIISDEYGLYIVTYTTEYEGEIFEISIIEKEETAFKEVHYLSRYNY